MSLTTTLAGPSSACAPALSAPIAALCHSVAAVRAQLPADLPEAQALAEAQVLLAELAKLQAVALARIADVHTRQLHTLVGSPSTGTWVEGLQVGLDRSAVALARKLTRIPQVASEVAAGRLSLAGAVVIGQALDRVRRHVDRPDGCIDNQPGDLVLAAVICDGALDVIAEARGGFNDDDPALTALQRELAGIADARSTELVRLEAAFLTVAGQVEPAQLRAGLMRLVDALLPVQLEDKVAQGYRRREFSLIPDPGGSGWLARGLLDLQTGELLRTVLDAEKATDPANATDTAARTARHEADAKQDAARAAHDHPAGPLPDATDPGAGADPRTRGQREHDALALALRRILDSGILGLRDKVAPHLHVTVSLDALHDAPGALPARTGSGLSAPISLARRWLADSQLTRTVLSLGRKVIETSHTERTLKAHERRALTIAWGGQCAGAGCTPSPGQQPGHLDPHHVRPWHLTSSTSLADTVPLCDRTHHDLHTGQKIIRLKDGRYITPTGWADGPGG